MTTQPPFIVKSIFATNGHRKGGDVELSRIFQCFGLRVAGPLPAKINPTRHCSTAASIRQANLQALQTPTNLGLSLQHHCCTTGLVQLPRRCQSRHASADDDNINNSIARRAATFPAKAPNIIANLIKASQRFIWSLMFSGWEQRPGQAGTLFAVMDIGTSG